MKPQCRRCKVDAIDSKALQNVEKNSEDFGNDKGNANTTITVSPNLRLIICLKCPKCGHCFTPQKD